MEDRRGGGLGSDGDEIVFRAEETIKEWGLGCFVIQKMEVVVVVCGEMWRV